MTVPCFGPEIRSVLWRKYLWFCISLLMLKYTQDTQILHSASQILDSRESTVDWSLGQFSSDFNII